MKELYWLLGTDDALQWHQRIILAPSLERAKTWWRDSLSRDAEIVLDLETLEEAIHVLDALSDGLFSQDDNQSLYAVWAQNDENLTVHSFQGTTPQEAEEAAQEEGLDVLAVVHAWPLLDGLARMRAVSEDTMAADEVLR